MFRELNSRLADLREKARQKEIWSRRVSLIEAELPKLILKRDQLERKFHDERRDVERLSGLSLGALFYALLGKKGEKLGREEAEMLQAKLQYEEAADTVADMEAELSDLKRRLADLRFVEDDIRRVLKEKSELIMRTYPALADRLRELTDRIAGKQADYKELSEALSAGRKALSALTRAEERLASAGRWGAYDMVGGGIIATAVKHKRIDEARSAIHDAQSALRRFQTELQDVKRDLDIRIEIGSPLTFADFFFDSLIFDWVVQGRINDSRKQIADKRRRIARIVADLESETRKAEYARKELEREHDELIENFQPE